MNINKIQQRLQYIFSNIGLSETAVTDQAHFTRDLGLDSLDLADLIVQAEHSFGLSIPDEDWDGLQTVGELKQYLATELNQSTERSALIH